jgi:hypothetical protein
MPVSLNYTTGLSNAWSNVATFVPKFVVFLIILVVGAQAQQAKETVSANSTDGQADGTGERYGAHRA